MEALPPSPASGLVDSASEKEKGVVEGEAPALTYEKTDKDESPASFYVAKFGVLGPILEKLFTSGVEARGVERVPEDQRVEGNIWDT